jgi:hypothetical protein
VAPVARDERRPLGQRNARDQQVGPANLPELPVGAQPVELGSGSGVNG